jgi:UDP-glucose 4-epimerase
MSVDKARVSVPPTVDRRILQSYLSDHLTGAAGGRARALKMSEWYADREIGPALAGLAAELDEEHAHLRELIDALDLRRGLPLQALARAGELVGRLKTNGRVLTRSPMTPLLEVELLRAAVNGKQGMWQLLADHADELGLDAADYLRRSADADRQQETLERLHAEIRPEALRPD